LEFMISSADVQQLYRQWQDGKLLDSEERNALRAQPAGDAQDASFADILKSAGDSTAAS